MQDRSLSLSTPSQKMKLSRNEFCTKHLREVSHSMIPWFRYVFSTTYSHKSLNSLNTAQVLLSLLTFSPRWGFIIFVLFCLSLILDYFPCTKQTKWNVFSLAVCVWFVTIRRCWSERFRELPRQVFIWYIQPWKSSDAEKLFDRTRATISPMEWFQAKVH